MKVEMRTHRVGPKVNDKAGDVIEVSEEEGNRLVAAKQAVKVEEKPKKKKKGGKKADKAERATDKAAENAESR